MKYTQQQLEDIAEVFAVIASYHDEIHTRTLLLMNVEPDQNIKALLKRMNLKLVDDKIFSLQGYEKSNNEEINILLEMATGTLQNEYAAWRIVDLCRPNIKATYNKCNHSVYDSYEDFFVDGVFIIMNAIKIKPAHFSGYVDCRLRHLISEKTDVESSMSIGVYRHVLTVKQFVQAYKDKNNGKEPSVDLICKETGFSKKRVEKYLTVMNISFVASDDEVFAKNNMYENSTENAYFDSEQNKTEAKAVSVVKSVVNSLEDGVMKDVILYSFQFPGFTPYYKLKKKYGLTEKKYKKYYNDALRMIKEKVVSMVPESEYMYQAV